MNTNLRYYAAAVIAIICLCVYFICFAFDDHGIVSFLNEYGYEVSARPIEIADITIPDPLDLVYQGYNEIQKKAGFDLEPYAGKRGTRYTYAIKNYPADIDGVRANIIVIDDNIVGGDICTVRIDGFMHELRKMSEYQ